NVTRSKKKSIEIIKQMKAETAVIGEGTDVNPMNLFYNDELYADLHVAPLSDDAPVYVLEGKEDAADEARTDYSNEDLEAAFDQLITHPTIADKSYIYNDFNSTAGGNTVQGSGFGAGIVG